MVAAPHRNRQGETSSVVVWAEDVTAQTHMGEERRRLLEAASSSPAPSPPSAARVNLTAITELR